MKKYILILIIIIASVLRLYKLESNPPSLYWDEASLGYNAYSILKTGHDEHGKPFPLTNFAAYGDYKPPGYIYATVPSIAVFGLNEFAIRFPSALFGILTVLLTYLIARELFVSELIRTGGRSGRVPDSAQSNNWNQSKQTNLELTSTGGKETPDRTRSEAIALLAAFFLAISPWHLQFSRGAFEANLGLFFSTLGIYFFLKFEKGKPIFFLLSMLSFIFGMYTFTGQRLFVPFIVLVLLIQFKNTIRENIKTVIPSLIIAAVLFWPLFRFATGTIEGRLRFNEVTIFKDLAPINESTKYRERDNFSLLSSIIYNRRLFYAQDYLKHYFDAFNPSFLFTKGDGNPRLSIQEVGELYLVDLPLILAGIYFLFEKKQKYRFLIIGWLLVSPLGPATARETPHALRMIHILPTFQLLAAWGFFNLYQAIKFKKVFVTFIFLLLAFQFAYYLHMYNFHWPKKYSGDWQYGYKQAVEATNSHYGEVDRIIVTKKLGRPYIYFLLYNRFDPDVYLQTARIVKDDFFFIDVEGFDKYNFVGDIADFHASGKLLYITDTSGTPSGANVTDRIKNLSGETVFEISRVDR